MKVKILNKSHKLGKYQGKIGEVVEIISPKLDSEHISKVKLYKIQVDGNTVIGEDNLMYINPFDFKVVEL